MKKVYFVILSFGIILLLVGAVGSVMAKKDYDEPFILNEEIHPDDFKESNNYYRGMNGRMGGGRAYQFSEEDEPMDLDLIIEEVEDYISHYNETLEIGDIFIFEDSEYYFSIIESDTGKGAMELLVNQYTGEVYPEYGPNMTWNLKYGMHNTSSMMNGIGNRRYMNNSRGMMGDEFNEFNAFEVNNFSDNNEFSYEEAYNKGEAYLTEYTDNLSLEEQYHEFYGYYTFHVTDGNQPIGMLSVNSLTGDVWYHDWHGDLIEIIEIYEDDH